MGVVNFIDYLRNIMQAGSTVEGNVVRVIADNGKHVGDTVFKVIQGGNGVASEVGVGVQAASGGSLVATGVAFMTTSIPTAVAAAAPVLGVLAGTGLYNLTPSFWDSIAAALTEAGETVGGKLITYFNGLNFGISATALNIIKNGLIAAGLFEYTETTTPYTGELPEEITRDFTGVFGDTAYLFTEGGGEWGVDIHVPMGAKCLTTYKAIGGIIYFFIASRQFFSGVKTRYYNDTPTYSNYSALAVTYNEETLYYAVVSQAYAYNPENPSTNFDTTFIMPVEDLENFPGDGVQDARSWSYAKALLDSSTIREGGENLQPGAKYPNEDEDVEETYPGYIPWEWPQTLPDPGELPTIYPVKYPEVEPDPYPDQEGAQDPEPESPAEIVPIILPDFIFDFDFDWIQPEPEPDPDPQPDPDPIPPDPEPDPDPDPIDPNPDPEPTPIVPIPSLPDSVNSNKLFTVYNPSASQLDALGGFLWDQSMIASLRDIWQDPMDGLISLIQIYASPTVGASQNIILGILNSGVSAPVVSNQFLTIDCGSVTVSENKENATDYAPYTSIHLFLPFIGVVELDTNECMNSSIGVKYKIDCYTGTCLAEVSVTRTKDMPNSPILYTYSGNCSQQIPLTSGNASGLLSTLIGAAATAISVPSGGSLGTVAGAQMLGNSLTHEMFHVSHSGNVSANAGIMGQKKPYLIIGRRHCYDANNYNSFYGYPANKTLVLGNHTGFVRIKKCWIKTTATQSEYDEIMRLLEEGVYM